MTPEEYKAAKEAWVSHLQGTSLDHVALVVLAAPVAFLFRRSIYGNPHSPTLDFFFNFFTLVFPIILGFTLEPRAVGMLYLGILGFSFLAVFFQTIFLESFAKKGSSGLFWKDFFGYFFHPEKINLEKTPFLANPLSFFIHFTQKWKFHPETFNLEKKPFLASFRAFMMLSTCTAILAVDFPIFPRYHGKTETYGISLMDVGVGAFVFSLGLVSQKARENFTTKKPSGGLAERAKLALGKSLPIFLLGFTRFFIIKMANYQEHYSEYGIHWNFFTTLAFLTILSTGIDFRVDFSLVVGVFLMIFQQILLSVFKVEDYINSDSGRDNVFSANREGIVSLPGYYALFLLATFVGHHLMKKRTAKEWFYFGLTLLAISLIIPIPIHYFSFSASRKMVNLPYIIYTCSLTLMPLSLFLLIELLLHPFSSNPEFLSNIADRRNSQLIFFLVANLLTGAINLTFQTIFCDVWTSYILVVGYMMAVCAIGLWVLDKLNPNKKPTKSKYL